MKPRDALDNIPYARFLDVGVEEDADGIVCVLPFRDDLVGNAALPAIHGGVVGAFLELTALVGLLAVGETQRVPKPINFAVDYLRSVGPRTTRGRAAIVKHGRRIANVRVVAWQDDPAKPVAAGIGNFLL
ncbi:MAG: PaaI family thioesterase [bacterium]|nr:PaaI family thioesterase [bacterium]